MTIKAVKYLATGLLVAAIHCSHAHAQMGDPRALAAKHALIYQAAIQASRQDPAAWNWDALRVTAEVKRSVIEDGYTPEELRDIFTMLAQEADTLWPSGHAAPPEPPNPNATPYGKPGTMPAAAADPLRTPDYKNDGRGFKGLEELYGSNGYLMNSLANRVNIVDYIIAKKNRVYMRFLFSADHTGTLFGFPGGPGKQIVDVRESAIVWFKDGKMTEANFIGDDLDLYRQLGGKLGFPNGGARGR